MRGSSTLQRREEILGAARVVLAEHGYERTTVSAIAQRASVAQGTFYLYFPSKEALPSALAAKLSSAMGAAAMLAAEQPDIAAAVDALVAGTTEAAMGFSDVLIVANRGIELCEDFAAYRAVTQEWIDGIEVFLLRFKETGEIDSEIDVSLTALVLRDVLDRAAKARVLFGETGYADQTATLVRRALAC